MYPHLNGLSHLLAQTETKRRNFPTPFEILTGAILPLGLAIVASMQTEGKRFFGFFVLAVLACSLTFYKHFASTVRHLFKQSKERRFVRARHAQLVHLIARFGEFVDPQSHNTFEELVRRELCHNSSDCIARLGMTRESILSDFWSHLNKRVRTSRITVPAFLQALDEFLNLVNNYTRFCLEPVFERLPVDMRNELRPHSRTELEAFRERFMALRERIEDFATDVSRSLTNTPARGYFVARPKPLIQAEIAKVGSGT